jgi:TetR/AcrR family transcriptional regulator, cholesterol catabolism regulator
MYASRMDPSDMATPSVFGWLSYSNERLLRFVDFRSEWGAKVVKPVTERRSGRPASSARREAMLELAAELFAEKGFRATTVRDIADAAGVLSGSLYHHFDSKESIVDKLLSEFLHDLLTRYQEVVAAGESPRVMLERFIEVAFDALPRHRAAIVVFQQDGAYLAGFERFGYINEIASQIERLWVEVIESGVAAGEFVTENPKLAYHFIRDAVWVSVRWYRPDGEWSTSDLSRQFIAVMINGLAPR